MDRYMVKKPNNNNNNNVHIINLQNIGTCYVIIKLY